MKFAVNYSAPLIHLIKEQKIKVDLIKCPDWDGMIKEANYFRDITIHFDLKAGLGNTFGVDFARMINLKAKTCTPHFNTHLVAPRNFDINSEQERLRMNKLWREEIQFMKYHLGPEAIALEHFPFTEGMSFLQYPTDYHVFSKVIEDCGCMLLLDLAHARITANTLGMNVKDYIAHFPLDRLVEMHVTGIKLHNGVLEDHFEMNDEDWDIFYWALEQIRLGKWRKPEIIAFEYGGVGDVFAWRTEMDVLLNQVPKLYETAHRKLSVTA